MNRRELFRSSLLGAVGIGAASTGQARVFPPNFDASKELGAPGWKPKFFDAHQNETLIAFSDLIVPETKTPGAKAALVNRFIDELMAAESRETQQDFLNSLNYLDGDARTRYKAPFAQLTPEFQHEYLSFVAYPHTLDTWREGASEPAPGYEHFSKVKDLVTRIYWNSEAGQKALGWNGGIPHGVFSGCDANEKTVSDPPAETAHKH